MKPRLLFMTGRVGSIFIGVIVLVMAVVLILPLPPGGNFPPALACAVLGMGLAQRDGAIVLIGLVVSVVAMIAVSYVTLLFIQQSARFDRLVWPDVRFSTARLATGNCASPV